ncbi:hypothetical protein GCM10023264_20200 [Sphingomonas daechungensis]
MVAVPRPRVAFVPVLGPAFSPTLFALVAVIRHCYLHMEIAPAPCRLLNCGNNEWRTTAVPDGIIVKRQGEIGSRRVIARGKRRGYVSRLPGTGL